MSEVILQHITAAREAGTLATVHIVADELAEAINADPAAVLKILHKDRDEANEIARRRKHVDFEVWSERLDERTTEALDAVAKPGEVVA